MHEQLVVYERKRTECYVVSIKIDSGLENKRYPWKRKSCLEISIKIFEIIEKKLNGMDRLYVNNIPESFYEQMTKKNYQLDVVSQRERTQI